MHDGQSLVPNRQAANHTRRTALQLFAGSAGGLLLARALANDALSRPLGRDDDSSEHDDSGHGRGRGRGGDDDRGRDDGIGDDDRHTPSQAAPPGGSMVVRIVSDDAGGFVPGELVVRPGDAVTFVNEHRDEHTATGSGFDTGIIPPGGSATVRLETAGRFAYACQIHPEMTGVIDVGGGVARDAPREASPAPPATTVSIVDFAFDPASVTIRPGASAAWVNDDTVPHTVTAVDGAFDSGILDPGARFSWTPKGAGTLAYRCQLHPRMEGTIVVEGDPVALATPTAAATPISVDASQQATSEPSEVAIVDFSFDPARVEIPAGTTIIWRNNGESPHTVTGDFADSGVLEPGASFSWRFAAPGADDYACAFHPAMTASVIVTDE